MENNHRFRTSDTTLATYLVTKGYLVIGVESESIDKRLSFIIDIQKDSPELVRLCGLFYAGQSQVEPSEFARTYSNLVKLTRQAAKEGENNG